MKNWLTATVTSLVMIFGLSVAHAQVIPPLSTYNEYVATFVCGKSLDGVLGPGTYRTAINVHNDSSGRAIIRKQCAIALPGEKPGQVCNWVLDTLETGEAFEIDWSDIRALFGLSQIRLSDTTFVKGFVVIQSKAPLDVDVLYTVEGSNHEVQAMCIERVDGHRKRGLMR